MNETKQQLEHAFRRIGDLDAKVSTLTRERDEARREAERLQKRIDREPVVGCKGDAGPTTVCVPGWWIKLRHDGKKHWLEWERTGTIALQSEDSPNA